VIQLFDPQSRLISELVAQYDDESDDFPETSCEQMGALIATQVVGEQLWVKDPALARRLFQEAGAIVESDEGSWLNEGPRGCSGMRKWA
jgi:hypothetical protein